MVEHPKYIRRDHARSPARDRPHFANRRGRYSTLLVNDEIELLQKLNQIVRSTECFRAAERSGKLTRVPTGDGMALLFFRSPEEPVQCALEIGHALKDYPHIQLRMGVHSGPVNRV